VFESTVKSLFPDLLDIVHYQKGALIEENLRRGIWVLDSQIGDKNTRYALFQRLEEILLQQKLPSRETYCLSLKPSLMAEREFLTWASFIIPEDESGKYLRTIFCELLSNALVHGVAGFSSQERQKFEEGDTFHAEYQKRLEGAYQTSNPYLLALFCPKNQTFIFIDSGNWITPSTLENGETSLVSGIGVSLIEKLGWKVEFYYEPTSVVCWRMDIQ
jgi:hypothetical protein